MSTTNLICAITPVPLTISIPSYPPYLNIKSFPDAKLETDPWVEIIIRSATDNDGNMGRTANITLNRAEFIYLCGKLFTHRPKEQ